jgi:hypothetical protein
MLLFSWRSRTIRASEITHRIPAGETGRFGGLSHTLKGKPPATASDQYSQAIVPIDRTLAKIGADTDRD